MGLLSDIASIIKPGQRSIVELNKDQIADYLGTNTAALEAFDSLYWSHIINSDIVGETFDTNAKQAAEMNEGVSTDKVESLDDIEKRIVNELEQNVDVYSYKWDGKEKEKTDSVNCRPVTKEEIMRIHEVFRPQLTGSLMQADIREPAYRAILTFIDLMNNAKTKELKKMYYDHFRQGLDILDLDYITYQILGNNVSSMGHWLPKIAKAVDNQDFFKIPPTRVIKVPLPMLQLSRLEYSSLTKPTLDIVDKFCHDVFELDETQEYFIKTGTFSSKFDFRNAKVTGAKEVSEIGEYLLFISNQAVLMASPFPHPSVYGVSTTNEWVVRKFIEPEKDCQSIYFGRPLHTEYRAFVDFDKKSILGIVPYWYPEVMKKRHPEVMKKRFDQSESPEMIHDSITYRIAEPELMKVFDENVSSVEKNLNQLLHDISGMSGKWSIDIMQNNGDFWIIDMALAAFSALKEYIPQKIESPEELWLDNIKV